MPAVLRTVSDRAPLMSALRTRGSLWAALRDQRANADDLVQRQRGGISTSASDISRPLMRATATRSDKVSRSHANEMGPPQAGFAGAVMCGHSPLPGGRAINHSSHLIGYRLLAA